jgi:hypothetical protein
MMVNDYQHLHLAALTVPLLETVMSEDAAVHPVVRACLLEGSLSFHVPSCVAQLRRGAVLALDGAVFLPTKSLDDFLKKL